ncbi:MAG: type IV toxin-antitoxin system AbiEi family antitoxin domain-containing protein [Hyphomonadaceae bacterium]
MASETGSKLNRLQQLVPEGLLIDAAWLEKQGYSHPLRQKYVAAGWLKSLGRGVFQRPAASLSNAEGPVRLSWELVVLSLQNLMQYGVSVGGRTALELQGLTHYLPAAGVREVHLYASEPLPSWFYKLAVDARWVVHNPDRLFVSAAKGLDHVSRTVRVTAHSELSLEDSEEELQWGHWGWPLTLSTPERAFLELLDELPTRESFDQVDALVDSLANLRPGRMQRLLEACQSVKVKRLFFVFADRHHHRWLKQLDRKRINLGSGKRALTPGGKLHPKYAITVPESLLQEGDGF